ncbi:phage major tail tube protein [Stenotrophomonas sp. MMGLT7]|uniref:phage major tail tube protein n=1 Tax=Stenotrophomonas sp. MMGLT7 TaxID=2901227 RepID=UPI001E307E9E|nr:phage major tail tube protein [Stenotrophomonas sp. MMGLT7]MCD7096978.1 phage major tail tube protein [Stenotrophomonas sp. MMGLT7]
MALPRKLKNFNVFVNGESYIGQAKTITLPTLTRTMENWRGGGMSGPVKADFGQEPIEFKAVYGGFMQAILNQYGAVAHDGVQVRFAGAYQRDDTGAVDAVEVVVRGRHSEIEFGDAAAGEDTEFTVTTQCSYYKITVNGATVVEIDLINMVEIYAGTDVMAAIRNAIGA